MTLQMRFLVAHRGTLPATKGGGEEGAEALADPCSAAAASVELVALGAA